MNKFNPGDNIWIKIPGHAPWQQEVIASIEGKHDIYYAVKAYGGVRVTDEYKQEYCFTSEEEALRGCNYGNYWAANAISEWKDGRQIDTWHYIYLPFYDIPEPPPITLFKTEEEAKAFCDKVNSTEPCHKCGARKMP